MPRRSIEGLREGFMVKGGVDFVLKHLVDCIVAWLDIGNTQPGLML